MTEKGRKSRVSCFAVAAGFLLAAAAGPTSAAASTPATDQYTASIPTSHGSKPTGGQKPHADRNALSPQARHAASGPSGKVLTQIATSRELGAPGTTGHRPSGSGAQGSGGSSGSPLNESNGSTTSGGGHVSSGAGGNLAPTNHALPAAVASTTGSGPAIAMLVILAAIAALGAFTLFRRRRAGRG